MARETVVKLIDDLDGSVADGTVTFSIDGYVYQIDLNSGNESNLRSAIAPFVDVARRVRGGGSAATGSARPSRAGDRERNTAIRTWALQEGVDLPARGRIANVVQDAFEVKDGDALREALGLELVEDKPRRGRARRA